MHACRTRAHGRTHHHDARSTLATTVCTCLQPAEYSIGFIESVSKEERKSGVEAWSLRVHDQLKVCALQLFAANCALLQHLIVTFALPPCMAGLEFHHCSCCLRAVQEFPYTSFIAKFSDDDIPYHRIAFISHRGTRVWWVDVSCSHLLYTTVYSCFRPVACCGLCGALPDARGVLHVLSDTRLTCAVLLPAQGVRVSQEAFGRLRQLSPRFTRDHSQPSHWLLLWP